MKPLLENQVCMITGGASGIGETTAKLFADEGASVILVDFNEKKLNSVASKLNPLGKHCTVTADLTHKDELIHSFDHAIEQYEHIDVLVCSAGILDYHSYIKKLTRELWDYTIAINQTAIFQCCREALKYMVPRGKGNIVLLSSLAAVAGNSGMAYTASKYAVVGICKNIAIEYATKGIRCNAVCPGETDTPLNHPSDEWIATSQLYADDDFRAKCFIHNRQDIPMCTAIQQANTILFLASDMSDGITGQSILVDGGMYISSC